MLKKSIMQLCGNISVVSIAAPNESKPLKIMYLTFPSRPVFLNLLSLDKLFLI